MSSDLGFIIFELQWKKKTGGNNREDVANMGIFPDSSLDWMTFKSYVCQNLGTMEDIYMGYVDSDGDELPIESECEFQEALKFARQSASKGREVVLKVDKRGHRLLTTPSVESKEKGVTASNASSDSEKDLKKKHVKINSKATSGDGAQSSPSCVAFSGMEEKKPKIENHNISNELSKKLACIMKFETEKRKKAKVDKDYSPPPWFKKYMQKFKSEIVSEVTANVTKQILENSKASSHSTCSSCCERNSTATIPTKTKKKKKISDDDSSDCAVSSDQRDHKLLKKIEKLHKREKKLEKKLDSKLEKLENKTKRRMEKKSQYKPCSEQPPERKVCSGSRKRLNEFPMIGTYLMDAVPLNDGLKTAELHIKLGECFTKVWEVMNNGTLPWTDKTELRLAWGTSGLEPETTVLKCPILLPGEKGEIAVTFRAPEFPGTFECYWHFYHMGDRFGHWLGCAVIVDSKEPECTDGVIEDKEECKMKSDQPVDLRMKCEPEQVANAPVPKSLENIYVTASEEKGIEAPTFENEKKITEFESDSDDEHLSVISGTISLSSDSEEDDNFVVVPMPACFKCDEPLPKSDTIPIDLNENSKDDEIAADMNEISENTKLNGIPTSDEQCPINRTDNERQTFTECDELSFLTEETSLHEEVKLVSHPKNVFAVDMEGHCMPVNCTWENKDAMDKKDSDSYKTKAKDEPESPQKHEKPKHERKEEPQGEHPKSASFHTHYHTHASSPFNSSFQTTFGQNYDTMFNQYTSSSSSNGFETSSEGTCFGSVPNQNQHQNPQNQNPQAAPVHILPETLVNGAINVASQAFTTARAVFNNLRSRPTEEFAGWHWDESEGDWSPQTDRSTTESLKILLEMGFTNKILNVLLLQRYDNDITKVVAELLNYKDNTGFVYNRQTQ